MDPEATAPPTTPRNILRHLWDWAKAHPDLATAILLIVAAFFLGRCTA